MQAHDSLCTRSALMNVWDVILRLYDVEINAGLQTEWDGGITVWLGGPWDTQTSALPREKVDAGVASSAPLTPVLAKATFLRSESREAADWLRKQAIHRFPAIAITFCD